MKFLKLLLGAVLICTPLVPATAQSLNTAQIAGNVQDATGAVLPGATVTLTQTDTGYMRTLTTNAAGAYTAPDLPLGPYRLQVTAPGFSTFVNNGIVLEVGTNPEINVKLALGSLSQEIVVETNGTMSVEMQSNGVGQVIDQKQVVELPLNGRDPTQLIALAGATTTAPSGDLNSNKNFPTITLAVAGGLPNGISYVLDGGSHNDVFNNLNLPIPFPDALQEFKVETSSLPAQYGDHASAAVNAITKGGGNKFHGDLFEFVRNYKFNARNFFAASRDSLKRNQFGGVIGGPILRNKLFFFGGFQGTIIRSNPSGTLVFVPTPAMMSGDFSVIASTTCQSKALTLGGPFVNNKINPSQFSQQALNIIKAGVPVSTGTVGTPGCGQINVPLSANSTSQQVIGRVDENVSSKQTLFARYFIARFNSPVTVESGDILEANQVAQFNQDQSVTIGDTYNVTPNIINSVRLTGNRTLGLRTLYPFFDPASVGINDYTTAAVKGFMGVSITNGFSIGQGGNNPGYFNSTDYQINDDVSISRGNHQVSFGGNYLWAYMNTVNNRPTNGAFTFNGAAVGANTIGYADFLTGNLDSFLQGNADYENDVYNYVALYAQDSWKIRKNVTVNYGVRWEPYMPYWNRNSHAENFSMSGFAAGTKSVVYPNAPAGMSFPGDKGYPGRSYNAGRINEFAPRIGFIVDPTGQGRTSLRAGYGLFFDTPQMFFDTRYSNSPPWGQTISLTGPLPLANPWSTYPGGDPFPALSTVSTTTPFVQAGVYVNTPLDYHPMYLQQWNVSLQQQVSTWLFGASYLGNKTTHLPTSYEADPAIYTAASGATLAKPNTNARRALYLQNPAQGVYYSTIGQLDDGGIANYNGMLVSAQRRAKTMNLVANYTFSHCLSEAETTELTGPSYVIPGNRHASYSNCDSDRRRVANVSLILNAPKLANRYTDLVLGGWGLSTIFTARSGGYFTVGTGQDNALSGIGGQIAIQTATPYSTRTNFGAYNYLNKTSFTTPALGTYTTTPPLTIRGPASYQLDMALLRSFPVHESQSVQFRWEVFNVPNEAIFTTLSSTLTSSNFGQFTSAADPRIMQVALKYIF
jgi:hypothetical protein